MDSEQKDVANLYAVGAERGVNWRRKYWDWEEKNIELSKHEDFDYYFNNWGFRSINEEDYTLKDENDIWCFGCSFTAGVGVPITKGWPSIIQKETNKKVKNFGVGGAGPKTMLRIMSSWYKAVNNKPKQIFVLGAFEGRDELWDEDGNCFLLQNNRVTHNLPYNPIKIDAEYTEIYEKIEAFPTTVRLDPAIMLADALKLGVNDRGRDNSRNLIEQHNHYGHPGVLFQKYVATRFLELIKT